MKHGIIVVLFSLCTVTAHAQWTNGQSASSVVGQSDYTTYTSGTTSSKFNGPAYITIDFINGKSYVSDAANNRVLRFSFPFTGTPPNAEMQFGTGGSSGTQINQFNNPKGVAVYNNKLYVADRLNHRILIFDNANTALTNPNASGIIGQLSYTSNGTGTSSTRLWNPTDIEIDGSGNLWVADESNNRVLKYSNIATKSTDGTAAADLVLGQVNFDSRGANITQVTMSGPHGVATHGTTVWVAEYTNNRILFYNNPSSNGQAASGVLGQSTFTSFSSGSTQSTLSGVEDVAVDGNGNVYVADGNNNRMMIYLDAAAKSNGANADYEFGQPGPNYFTTSTNGVGQAGLKYPWAVCVDNANNKIYVADYSNNRILGFTAASALPVELSSFTASVGKNIVSLRWNTATETNNYGFEIQRSADSTPQSDKVWTKVGFAEGSGTTNAPKSYSYTDKTASGKISYRLKQIDRDGKFEYSQSVEVTAVTTPKEFVLGQNFPNPFNPTTMINYQIPVTNHVSLKVFDMLGKEVATLVNETKETGSYSAKFDGAKLSSGIYFYKLQSGKSIAVKKLTIMK